MDQRKPIAQDYGNHSQQPYMVNPQSIGGFSTFDSSIDDTSSSPLVPGRIYGGQSRGKQMAQNIFKCLCRPPFLILFALIIGVVIAFTFLVRRNPGAGTADSFTCITPECVMTSYEILHTMAANITETDVCKEPYKFACGNTAALEMPAAEIDTSSLLARIDVRTDLELREIAESMELSPHGSSALMDTDPSDGGLYNELSKFYDQFIYVYKMCKELGHDKDLYSAPEASFSMHLNDLLSFFISVNYTKESENFDDKNGVNQLPSLIGNRTSILNKYGIPVLFKSHAGSGLSSDRTRRLLWFERPDAPDYDIAKGDNVTNHFYVQYISDLFYWFSEDILAVKLEDEIISGKFPEIANDNVISKGPEERAMAVFEMDGFIRSHVLSEDVVYIVKTWKDFKAEYSAIDWDTFVNPKKVDKKTPPDDEKVIIDKLYMDYLFKSAPWSTDWNVYNDYLLSQFLLQYGKYVSMNMFQSYKRFRENLSHFSDAKPMMNYNHCLYLKPYSVVLYKKYFDKYFSTAAQVDPMIGTLKEEFHKLIKITRWITKDMKTRMTEKIQNMYTSIGYSQGFERGAQTIDIFNEVLGPLPPTKSRDMYSILSKHAEHLTDQKMNRVNQTDYLTLVEEKSLYEVRYFPEYNMLIVPLSFARSPLMHSLSKKDDNEARDIKANRISGLLAVNYANLGFLVASSMSESLFGSKSMYFDFGGDYNSWWSSNAKNRLKTKQQCLKSQNEHFSLTFHYHGDTWERAVEQDSRIVSEYQVTSNAGLITAWNAFQTDLKAFMKSMSYDQKNFLDRTTPLPGLDYNPLQIFFLSHFHLQCFKTNPEHLLRLFNTEHMLPEAFVESVITNIPSYLGVFPCFDTKQSEVRCKVLEEA